MDVDKIAQSMLETIDDAIGEVTQTLNEDPREGTFTCSEGEMISMLRQFLTAKYVIEISYRNFADRITGPWRDGLVDHLYEHAKEERDHQYSLTMKLVSMGVDPMIGTIQIPQVSPEIRSLFQNLMELELQALEVERKIIACCGDNVGLRVLIENMSAVDDHHLQDLIRLSE